MEGSRQALVGDGCDDALNVQGPGSVAVLWVFGVPVFVVVYKVWGGTRAARSAVGGVWGGSGGVIEE